MRRRLIPVLLVGFLYAGCSSGNSPPPTNTSTNTASNTSTNTASNTSTNTSTSTVTNTSPDAGSGCDEAAVGENYFIQNCTPGGNGTPILRQLPTVVANHCNPS